MTICSVNSITAAECAESRSRVLGKRFLFAAALMLFGSCTSHQEQKIQLGGINYCVPRQNQVEESLYYAWLPKELPKGGFRFFLPVSISGSAKNDDGVLTSKIYSNSMTGLVDEFSRYANWRKPKRDTYYWKVITSRAARMLVAHGRYVASGDPEGSYILVWKPGTDLISTSSDFSDKAEVIAQCDVNKNFSNGVVSGVREQGCNRVIFLGNIAVQYDFSADLLDYIDLLDKRVSDTIYGWRCK